MTDLRERFGAYFGNINLMMTALRNNETWREDVMLEIENLASAVRAEEREACAKACEDLIAGGRVHSNFMCAAAIRGRP